MKAAKSRNETGQALTEFVLGLLVVISFFFFYVKMAAVFAIGNYIHYATFMAARAYYSSATNQAEQTQNAETVLRKMLAGRWKSVIKPDSGGNSAVKGASVGPGEFHNLDPNLDHWNQGVSFHYKSLLSLYPWSKEHQSVKLDLTSESWLGREESAVECNLKKGKIQSLLGASGLSAVPVEWDNGC